MPAKPPFIGLAHQVTLLDSNGGGWNQRVRSLLLRSGLCIALALGLDGACHAHAKFCSPAAAAAAELDGLDTWPKVRTAFERYGQCDDGSIAEGNSEAVARLLVDQWATLPILAGLVRRDPALKRFVLRHIDTTIDTDDLDRIKVLAASRCPVGIAPLCVELAAAATRANR